MTCLSLDFSLFFVCDETEKHEKTQRIGENVLEITSENKGKKMDEMFGKSVFWRVIDGPKRKKTRVEFDIFEEYGLEFYDFSGHTNWPFFTEFSLIY